MKKILILISANDILNAKKHLDSLIDLTKVSNDGSVYSMLVSIEDEKPCIDAIDYILCGINHKIVSNVHSYVY